MQPITTTRKITRRLPVAVLCVIVVLLCLSLFPPVSAATSTGSVTISAKIGGTVISADFTSDITDGMAPLTVRFKDTTIGKPDSYLWDFGDGQTSTEQNPTHEYKKSGLYTVTLKVTFPSGVISSKKVTNYIGAWASS
jgi:PKD repeat protein